MIVGCYFFRTIYSSLSSAFVDEVKEIYLQRVEEITPNMRYCEYNIGDDSAVGDLMQMRLKSGADGGVALRLDVSIVVVQLLLTRLGFCQT